MLFGSAAATYTLPANTPAGQYTIEAVYSGTVNYLPATDTSHFLTVMPAATATTTPGASVTFSGATNQAISLSARSAAGPARSTKAS